MSAFAYQEIDLFLGWNHWYFDCIQRVSLMRQGFMAVITSDSYLHHPLRFATVTRPPWDTHSGSSALVSLAAQSMPAVAELRIPTLENQILSRVRN
jgi:hypothetical protein